MAKSIYKFKIVLPNRTLVEDTVEAQSSHLAKQIMEARYPGANCMVVGVVNG